MLYHEELKINKDRLAVLIGKKGETKRVIESRTETKIKVDSKEGDVIINGSDSLKVYLTKLIILAISRGFNPDIAVLLANENMIIEVINIQDFSGKSKSKEIRTKGRLIGTQGKAKHLIEQLTNTDISIYGKTVAIIGKVENAILARRALEMLLKGSKHGNVYSWLEKQQQHLKEAESGFETGLEN